MTDEEMLNELRAIKYLLAISTREPLGKAHADLDEIHRDLLDELSISKWKKTNDIQERLAEKHDVSKRTIRGRRKDLLEKGLLKESREDTTKYKATAVGQAVNTAFHIQKDE